MRKITLSLLSVGLFGTAAAASPWVNDQPCYEPGRFGDALRFDFWQSRLFLKTPGLLNPKEGTLQFWIAPVRDSVDFEGWGTVVCAPEYRPGNKFTVFNFGLIPPICHRQPGKKSFFGGGIHSKEQASPGRVEVDWKKGEWHAVAFTWGPEGTRLYLDGRLVKESRKAAAFDLVPEYISFGGGTSARYGIASESMLDEIELSDCVRPVEYIRAFAAGTQAPKPDAHTLALHHCDRGDEGYTRMTDRFRQANQPTLTWNSGLFSDFGTFPAGAPARLPFTLTNPGAKAARFTVAAEVFDYAGSRVTVKRESFEVAPGAVREAVLTPEIKRPGWYRYRLTADAGGRSIAGEEHFFVALPQQPEGIPAESNFFGSHLSRMRKTDFFTRAGIPWERDMFSFLWKTVEPEPGVWDWRAGDFMIEAARRDGMKLVGVLGAPALWASRGRVGYDRAPRDLAAFEDYVFRVVTRYKGDVRYWEVCNEPDWFFGDPGEEPRKQAFLAGNADYLELLKAAHRGVKRADPEALVISGGFVPHPHLLKYLTAHGGGDYFDILGMHRYRPWEHLNRYRQWFKNHPAWQTEHLTVTPADVALDVFFALKDGYKKNFFFDVPTSVMTHFATGRFDAHGWEPQPAFYAMAQTAAKLGGAEITGPIRPKGVGDLVSGLLYRRNGVQGAVFHSLGAGSGRLRLSFTAAEGGTLTATGLMGVENRFELKKGESAAVDLDIMLFVEGPFASDSFRVLAETNRELLQNADFSLLQGDIGVDREKGMKPLGWQLEEKCGPIRVVEKGALSLTYQTGKPSTRAIQWVAVLEPGTYVLRAEFSVAAEAPELVGFLQLIDTDTKEQLGWSALKNLPVKEWKECALPVRIDTAGKRVTVVFGAEREFGELLVRNLRFRREVDPALLKKTVFIDLGTRANRPLGFSDGGELSGTDLSLLPRGIEEYGGALFKVGERCLMLGKAPGFTMPADSGAIAVDARVAELNLLATSLFVTAKPGETLGSCRIVYRDGTTASFSLIRGENLDDWYPPAADKRLPVARSLMMPGGGDRNLYRISWRNPRPEEEIRSLTATSANNQLLIVAAISATK